MVAGMLGRCGLYMGEESELSRGDVHNPAGYWEHAGVRIVTQKVLNRLTEKYGSPVFAPSGWHIDPELSSFYSEAADVVSDFDKQSENWGWKYPPASLIIPFWRRVVPNLKFVLCLRNPLDVASSYTRFNPFDSCAARSLWAYHTAQVLLQTEPADRVVSVYEAYFPSYRVGIRRLREFVGLPMPEPGSELDARLAAFHRGDLKHHASTVQDLVADTQSSYLVKELYIELLTGGSDASFVPIMAHADVFMPFVARAVAAEAERRHLQDILQSRTHRWASSVCEVLMKSPIANAARNGSRFLASASCFQRNAGAAVMPGLRSARQVE